MQHAAHVLAYHRHMFFSANFAIDSDEAVSRQLLCAKYLWEMNLANSFRDANGYKRPPLKKLDELEGELEVWLDDIMCEDLSLDEHSAPLPPRLDVLQRDSDKRWLIVADFGDDVYSSHHHHLAMCLVNRGVCVYRHSTGGK